MTDPLDVGPVEVHERGFRRELLGLLLVLAGVVALGWLLCSVDWRLAAGLAAVGAIAAGVRLGVHEDDGS